MSRPSTQCHKIWIEQCEAAEDIRKRYGQQRALDYLIADKLFNFVMASERRPEFAAELPLFVRKIRLLLRPRTSANTSMISSAQRSLLRAVPIWKRTI